MPASRMPTYFLSHGGGPWPWLGGPFRRLHSALERGLLAVQLCLRPSLDPGEHLRAGTALADLRDQGVLVIGSGMSCHERGAQMAEASPRFDAWLRDAFTGDPLGRDEASRAWEPAPHARSVHPREEHRLPLMVAAGAAQSEPAACIHGERLLGHLAVSSYRFGR